VYYCIASIRVYLCVRLCDALNALVSGKGYNYCCVGESFAFSWTCRRYFFKHRIFAQPFGISSNRQTWALLRVDESCGHDRILGEYTANKAL